MNPWGLTDREGEVLDALLEHGTSKYAAKALGLSHRTVEAHLRNIIPKMPAGNKMKVVVLWDRWATAQRAANANALLLQRLAETGVELARAA